MGEFLIEKKIVKSFKKNFAANEELLSFSKLSEHDIFLKFETGYAGYDDQKAEESRKKFGANELKVQKEKSFFSIVVESFINPFTIVLFLLCVVSVFANFLDTSGSDNISVGLIILLVLISGVTRLIEEVKFEKTAKKLVDMVHSTAAVLRNKKWIKISSNELVVGDIVKLAIGDIIPADIRILKSKNFFVSQSSLSGESEPVEKSKNTIFEEQNPIYFKNIAFMGSNVISGLALGIVISTGNNTLFGNIANTLSEKKAETNLNKSIKLVSWLIVKFMIVMIPIVFLISAFRTKNWLEAFLFSISIAVGLTPEMLPVIVTTNLVKGSANLSKKNTVIKNLNSIQSFGAMDILCTDKTGTLTQDKVMLCHYLNPKGEKDIEVLKYAYLNSFFQSGYKNLIDAAILSCQDVVNNKACAGCSFKGEIPFDFTRRRLSVIIKGENEKLELITKGAVEEVLLVSKFVKYGEKIVKLNSEKNKISKLVKKLSSKGMRLVAVAIKNYNLPDIEFNVKDENDMTLVGFLTFLDPPKESVTEALLALKAHGVKVKILTGDSYEVTKNICEQVNFKVDKFLLGSEIDSLSDDEILKLSNEVQVFAKLTPIQKSRIVNILKKSGHVVGFLGDGINDAPALKSADVGISVDSAVDVAKESADIILLEKNLMVLETGVIEGRRIFGNIVKYIKITISANFSNMLSVVASSLFLPFLPMAPMQILVLNLLYDFSCIGIPWDKMDKEYMKEPRSFKIESVKNFTLWFGTVGCIFDILTFLVLYFNVCPAICGVYNDSIDKSQFINVFQTGWFIESLCSQTFILHALRSRKFPLIKDHGSIYLTTTTFLIMLFGLIVTFTKMAKYFLMTPLPFFYLGWLCLIIGFYLILITIVKKFYISRFGQLL